MGFSVRRSRTLLLTVFFSFLPVCFSPRAQMQVWKLLWDGHRSPASVVTGKTAPWGGKGSPSPHSIPRQRTSLSGSSLRDGTYKEPIPIDFFGINIHFWHCRITGLKSFCAGKLHLAQCSKKGQRNHPAPSPHKHGKHFSS